MRNSAAAPAPRRDRVARAIASTLSPRGDRARLTVFGYHQVLEKRDPLRPGEPDQADFDRDLAVMKSVFTLLPLDEAVRQLNARTLPTGAACITFDDGYANNQTLAAPVLEAHGVPATFFVTGGACDDGVMWNDLVIEAVARRGSALVLKDVSWSEERRRAAGEGPALVAAILAELKYRPLAQRLAAAERIYRDNVGEAPPRLMMTRSMVADLAARGFDVGGHTLTHPILCKLPAEQARSEIAGCAAWLKQVTGRTPKTFAYPNGRPGTDFDASHEAMVREAGFSVAVSTTWSTARAGTNPYDVPRVGPWWRGGASLTRGLLKLYVKSYLR
jgi:peptidoglycan/xylan/chitin deacetylase (PgdA/CDA1 family)